MHVIIVLSIPDMHPIHDGKKICGFQTVILPRWEHAYTEDYNIFHNDSYNAYILFIYMYQSPTANKGGKKEKLSG